jgi:hypothetical protein
MMNLAEVTGLEELAKFTHDVRNIGAEEIDPKPRPVAIEIEARAAID